jgi:hypothetical protein
MDTAIKQQEQSKWKQERERLERQRRETTRQSVLLRKHQATYRNIKEANEICQKMNKNIRFKPCLMKIAYDGEGRKMTIMGGSGTEQLKDDL